MERVTLSVTTPCLLWRGTVHHTGYGVLEVRGRQHRAHRYIWTWANGPVPPGLVVMHACDNRLCINIDHLQLGTPGDNTRDRNQKGRNPQTLKTRCVRGHPLDRRRPNGDRWCSVCSRERNAARYAARRVAD